MAGLARRKPFDLNRSDTPNDVARHAAQEAEERATDERFRQHADLTKAPYYLSIRFRLTAWYALILIVVIVSFGTILRTLVIRELEADVDGRLLAASQEVAANTNFLRRGAQFDTSGNLDIEKFFGVNPSSFDSILLSGLWLAVFDKNSNRVSIPSAPALNDLSDDLARALADGQVLNVDQDTYRTIDVGGTITRVYVHPLEFPITEGDPEVVGSVLVGESLGTRDRIINLVNKVLLVTSVAGIGFAVWGGWILAGRALAPVERITRTADGIANSEGVVSLSRRLDVPNTGDELSRLALTFNAMLDRIEAAFNAQRRFVGDASHELRTPLTSVRGNVDVLLRQHRAGRPGDPDDVAVALGDVQRESARMGRLIDDLLTLARTDISGVGYNLKPGVVSLDVLAEEAFKTASSLPHVQNMVLSVNEPVTIDGDGDRLVQVMIILLDNALRYTPPDGRVELRVTQAIDVREEVSCARIDVQDTGPGIAAEHLPSLFQRFYRVDHSRARSGGGTGLGLSIALAIVRGHGGWIDVETADGEGTTFTVWLPLVAPDRQPEHSATASGADEQAV